VLGPWLIEAAARLADTLRGTGPDTKVWTPVPGATAEFCARRFAHETAVHRADATLAIGAEFRLGQDVALDAIDEWMELGSLPMHFEVHPWMRELLDPGRTLHFHATDMAPQAAAEWLIDLTGGAIAWRRAHEKAAVAVRGPLTDLPLWASRNGCFGPSRRLRNTNYVVGAALLGCHGGYLAWGQRRRQEVPWTHIMMRSAISRRFPHMSSLEVGEIECSVRPDDVRNRWGDPWLRRRGCRRIGD